MDFLIRLRDVIIDRPGVLAQLVVAVIAILVSAGFVAAGTYAVPLTAVLMAVSALLAAMYGSSKTVNLKRVRDFKTGPKVSGRFRGF